MSNRHEVAGPGSRENATPRPLSSLQVAWWSSGKRTNRLWRPCQRRGCPSRARSGLHEAPCRASGARGNPTRRPNVFVSDPTLVSPTRKHTPSALGSCGWGRAERLRLRPHDSKTGNPTEVPLVAGDDSEVVGERCRAYPEVGRADGLTVRGQVCVHCGMEAGNGGRDRHHGQRGQQVLRKGDATGAACSSSPMRAVQQLRDRDHADRAALGCDEIGDRCPVTLRIDQDVGVDQEGQGGGSGATRESCRIRRTSLTYSSSTPGAVTMISRKRSADVRRTRGGPMDAAGSPARVTSNSSPAKARVRTSAKFLDASLAVTRAMTGTVSDISDFLLF
jgi:hypothetical protein